MGGHVEDGVVDVATRGLCPLVRSGRSLSKGDGICTAIRVVCVVWGSRGVVRRVLVPAAGGADRVLCGVCGSVRWRLPDGVAARRLRCAGGLGSAGGGARA